MLPSELELDLPVTSTPEAREEQLSLSTSNLQREELSLLRTWWVTKTAGLSLLSSSGEIKAFINTTALCPAGLWCQ